MPISPMMQQYLDAKRACPEAVLLFRMGDFYELFYDDAQTAARVLKLTLTSREKGANAIPMAGFPYHQLEGYLAKLIASGLRVAVCDQVEDPRQAKGLVRREVTRIVSPGTVTDDALLDPRENNYLAAVVPGEIVGLAWVELSTGRFLAAQFPAARLADELARVAPAECLVSEEREPSELGIPADLMVTRRANWVFTWGAAQEALEKQFGRVAWEGFGFAPDDTFALRAAGAILDYLQETQKSSLGHIDRLLAYRASDTLEIDESTRRSLEITRTLREGKREGSLLATIDRTVTAMGSRMLADWVANPLTTQAAIDARLDAVGELLAERLLLDALREQLRGIYDLQRLLARVTTGRATPRDLCFLGKTLSTLPALKAKLTARRSARLNELENAIDLCPDIRGKLEAALIDDCPLSARDGGFIRSAFHAPLDALRELAAGGKQWIAQYQAREAERIGIPSLKCGFNKVFGYYLEITHTHQFKAPPEYIRKQTVKNAERYVTPELKEYEEKVLTADERAQEMEYQLFVELREVVACAAQRLQATATVLAELDALAALAELARQRNYCRPEISVDSVLQIVDGRHPVLDISEPEGTFVPNDVSTAPDGGFVLLITGPNMAGKSTYIRQVALLTLLAQIGSYVPARSATIGIADRIFARVGASDELARGRSTFMVEMTETARILNTATPRSLVILDEIGRGTSTYDGLSIAWSVVEHLHDQIGCRTLFATHYHELTDLAKSLPGVQNLNVAVREWDEQVIFLHKIVPGAADKSYGIHVARLAGVPRSVNERAKQILGQLEAEHVDERGQSKIARRDKKKSAAEHQLFLFEQAEHPLLERVRALDINETTPLEALRILSEWQDLANRDGSR